MKIMQKLLLVLLTIAMSSCISETVGPPGPAGPQGPEGPVGAPGDNAFVFEYTGVDFLAPNYEVYLDYPSDFEGLDSDVALVYLLWDVTTDNNGNDLEIWRQVPQTLLTANGLLMYNFDFSKIDVHLFLATEFNPDLLEPIDTDDWVVRVVIVPGSFWGRTSIDHSDYNAVKEAYGLPELQIHSDVIARR
jgi:hypothetical protein